MAIKNVFFCLLFFFGCANTSPTEPTLSDTPKQPALKSTSQNPPKNPRIFEVACIGTSISLGFAREAAITDCKKSAPSFLDSTIKVNSKIWDTKNDIYFHNETDSMATYEGLECQVLKERYEELQDQVKVFLDCRFDLSKVKAMDDVPMKNGELIEIKEKKITEIQGDRRIINLATFPQCDKIFTGEKEITCNKKNMTFGVKQNIKEIIVEKKGYMPYRIQMNNEPQTTMVIFLSPL